MKSGLSGKTTVVKWKIKTVYPYLDRECGCVTVTRVIYVKVHVVFICMLQMATYLEISLQLTVSLGRGT